MFLLQLPFWLFALLHHALCSDNTQYFKDHFHGCFSTDFVFILANMSIPMVSDIIPSIFSKPHLCLISSLFFTITIILEVYFNLQLESDRKHDTNKHN